MHALAGAGQSSWLKQVYVRGMTTPLYLWADKVISNLLTSPSLVDALQKGLLPAARAAIAN